MKVNRCKGSRDLSPDEMVRFRLIEDIFREHCLRWGYEEVRTPILEYLHLFTAAGTLTPGLLGRVYSFLDWDGWSGERVVLRPDGTIPVARLYTDSMEDRLLARLFYVANVFIFEATGRETREKWQCGTELIGGTPPLADVELIMLSSEILNKLGLGEVELRLSHAGLIRAMLGNLGLSPEEQTRVFDKILDGDINALTMIENGKPELGKVLPLLMKLKGKSPGFLKNLKALFAHNLSELEPPLKEFIGIVDLLEALGCRYQIDLASGRGFEYYTGIIFQLIAGNEVVGGGGRYDALIPLIGGKSRSASGFALYLDRLMGMVKPETSLQPQTRVLVRAGSDASGIVRESFKMARYLRKAGYIAEIMLGVRETAGSWLLEVRDGAPNFILTHPSGQQKLEIQTAEEVVASLKRQ